MPKDSARQVAVEAKHLRPRFDHVSLRADATRAFASAFEHRLVVVCAPAGYGKTTTTAAALERCGKSAAWYKLDILDHDPLVFLASIIRAVRRVHPEFAGALLRELEAGPILEAPVEVLAAQFCFECDKVITRDLHLVLDDYHEAMDSGAMNNALGYIIENSPATLHFLVLTRYEPTFRLEKLNLAGDVVRLQRDLFLLDVGQVAEVLADRSGRPHDRDDVARLLEITEGWAASVVLAGMALAWLDVASLKEVLGDPRMRGDVFSYLAEQVFQRQADDVQRFLLQTCCLEHVTAELGEALTGSADASRHLSFLARNHIFTFDTERTGAYRYHNLLRDFLRQRFMQEEGESEFRALQRRTAVALEQSGDSQGAVELLLGANEPELALGAIGRGGEALLERRPSEQLRTWSERLSANLRCEREPWALIVDAVIAARDSNFGCAFENIDIACSQLERLGDTESLYQALSIREWAEFWSGDCEASMATCGRALELASTDAQRVHTLLSLSSAALDMRRWKDVDSASQRASQLLDRARAEDVVRAGALRAHAAFYQGDMRAAHSLIIRCHDPRQTNSQRVATLNTQGMIETALGRFAKARRHFHDAVKVADAYGQVLASSMIEDNIALLDASAGESSNARERLLRLIPIAQDLDPTLHCCALTHMGTVLRREGLLLDSLEPTLGATETVSEERDPYLALNARANLAFAEGLAGAEREGRLRRLSESAKRAGVRFVELKSLLYAAILAALDDRLRLASRALGQCIPAQLRLGHLNLVMQELCPRPEVAMLALRDEDCNGVSLPLLLALSRHPSFNRAAPLLRQDDKLRGWIDRLLASRSRQRGALEGGSSTQSPGAHERYTTLRVPGLTPRELEVLRLMSANHSNLDIAKELFVAVSTVKTHVNHILTKMGQPNRIGAILEYQRLMRISDEAAPSGDLL